MVGGLPVREAIEYARAAEEAGVGSFWVHETYGLRDALSYLTAAALVTNRIELGAGCVNGFTRSAALMAMSSVALQELAGGRFRLGIGTASLASSLVVVLGRLEHRLAWRDLRRA